MALLLLAQVESKLQQMHEVCLVCQIMKLAVDFIGLHFIVRLQIKPPQIANHDVSRNL